LHARGLAVFQIRTQNQSPCNAEKVQSAVDDHRWANVGEHAKARIESASTSRGVEAA
jgi:hypothetical protein